jgi:hypothetical protein
MQQWLADREAQRQSRGEQRCLSPPRLCPTLRQSAPVTTAHGRRVECRKCRKRQCSKSRGSGAAAAPPGWERAEIMEQGRDGEIDGRTDSGQLEQRRERSRCEAGERRRLELPAAEMRTAADVQDDTGSEDGQQGLYTQSTAEHSGPQRCASASTAASVLTLLPPSSTSQWPTDATAACRAVYCSICPSRLPPR